MSNWISVKDKLPEKTFRNILFVERQCVRFGWYNGYFIDNAMNFDDKQVTHWQPLPKPPEKEIGKPKITKQKDGSTIVHFKIKAEAPNKPTEVI